MQVLQTRQQPAQCRAPSCHACILLRNQAALFWLTGNLAGGTLQDSSCTLCHLQLLLQLLLPAGGSPQLRLQALGALAQRCHLQRDVQGQGTDGWVDA